MRYQRKSNLKFFFFILMTTKIWIPLALNFNLPHSFPKLKDFSVGGGDDSKMKPFIWFYSAELVSGLEKAAYRLDSCKKHCNKCFCTFNRVPALIRIVCGGVFLTSYWEMISVTLKLLSSPFKSSDWKAPLRRLWFIALRD